MIAIVNITPGDKIKYHVCTYEVRINQKIICTFEHDRRDGLEICLSKAAKAVGTKKYMELARLAGLID